MSKIIVGVDGPDRSDDSRSPRAWPVAPRRRSCSRAPTHTTTRATSATRNGATVCARTRSRCSTSYGSTPTRGSASRRTIADTSPSRALHILAEIERASLVVIGSSHRGAVGRVFAGTTAERLLHGAPCPVAGAAGTARGEEISRIAVGWDGSAEATAALDAAVAIARAVGAELRVVEVLDIQWAGTRDHPGSGPALAANQPAARARVRLDESFPACRRMCRPRPPS